MNGKRFCNLSKGYPVFFCSRLFPPSAAENIHFTADRHKLRVIPPHSSPHARGTAFVSVRLTLTIVFNAKNSPPTPHCISAQRTIHRLPLYAGIPEIRVSRGHAATFSGKSNAKIIKRRRAVSCTVRACERCRIRFARARRPSTGAFTRTVSNRKSFVSGF